MLVYIAQSFFKLKIVNNIAQLFIIINTMLKKVDQWKKVNKI